MINLQFTIYNWQSFDRLHSTQAHDGQENVQLTIDLFCLINLNITCPSKVCNQECDQIIALEGKTDKGKIKTTIKVFLKRDRKGFLFF